MIEQILICEYLYYYLLFLYSLILSSLMPFDSLSIGLTLGLISVIGSVMIGF
jgi:threonine aldolase